MTFPSAVTEEIQKLAPSAIIELFEIDLTPYGGSIYRFHAGTNQVASDIVFDGNTYTRYPIEVSGFEFGVNGQFPRPKMRISNAFGLITGLILTYNSSQIRDLVGAKVTRIRTLVKFLDAVNFTGGVNPSEDPTAEFPRDYFYIDRKSLENRDVVEFELASSLDMQGVLLPRRVVLANICPWVYRGTECAYAGSNYYDANDSPVSTLAQDVCGKRVSSCRLRFGTGTLRFGGFPAVGSE